jgi:hypothetical protein
MPDHEVASRLEAIVLRLEKHLLGNGQPGLIQELREADTTNQKAIRRLQGSLEHRVWNNNRRGPYVVRIDRSGRTGAGTRS